MSQTVGLEQETQNLGSGGDAATCRSPLIALPSPLANYVFASCICLAVLFLLLASSQEMFHWFVLPVFVCGVLMVVDALDWVWGVVDRFDLRGLIGLFGFHFFFLAPLLHVYWGYFMWEVQGPPDWRDWLGKMAFLNLLGIVLYRSCVGARVLQTSAGQSKRVWTLNEKRFFMFLVVALPLSALLQVWVYSRFGGITGYIEAARDMTRRNSMQGMGMVFMFSEVFPILSMIGFALCARHFPRLRSWGVLIGVMAVFLVLALFFGGLRGNRSNTVWNLFWAVGIIHFWIRPIPRWLIMVGLISLTTFMYAYGLFKGAGLEAVEALESAEARQALAEQTRRPVESVLLDDFGRSDVQAFLLYRLMMPGSDYEYAWGRTYAVSLAILVPRSLWPERPPNMAKEGTEAQFGMGTFEPDWSESSRVYGLAGEAMLNFGPVAVPFVFMLWGLVVAFVRRLPLGWSPDDARLLLYPLAVILAFSAVFQDTENQLFFVIKYGAVPFLLIRLASTIGKQCPLPLQEAQA